MSNLNLNLNNTTTFTSRDVVNGPDTVRSAQFDWMRGLLAQHGGVFNGGAVTRDNGSRANTDHAELLAVFEALSRIPG